MFLAALALCATCHPTYAAHYAKTGMGRAFAPASPATVPVTSRPFHHAASDTWFAILRRGSAFLHRRWRLDAGREEYVEELAIHYVLGSGNHARTFLHRNARGELVELPLGWYAENGGKFAMNPGFDTHAPPTRRKIGEDCLACHNSYPRGPNLPAGIGCERCHGDGARHVAAAQAKGAQLAAIRAAIVNPARLPGPRRDEVCYQCHLETTSTSLPGMIRRYGRPAYSYQPGEPLSNAFYYFDHAPGRGRDDKFEIVSAAYRLRQSACFRQSETLTCTTCHNPHGRPRPASAPCLTCHAAAHHPQSDCAGCHMPKRRTEDAVHVVMTDHKIQRTPPPGDLLAPRAERHPGESEEYRGPVVPYLTDAPPLYTAVAQVLHGANLGDGVTQLAAALAAPGPPKPVEAYLALGNAQRSLRRFDQAVAAFEQAAQRQPNSAREHRNLGIALLEAGQPARAESAFRRATSLSPSDAPSWYQLALLASRAGNLREAVGHARHAIALDPDLLDARNSLGVNLTALGDATAAETAFRDALQIDPYFATAHSNLARLLGTRGDLTAALRHFAQALLYRPLFAPDRYDFAVTLARANRNEEALAQTESALSLDPQMVDARVLAGILHARQGRPQAARRELEAALKIRPDHPLALRELDRLRP